MRFEPTPIQGAWLIHIEPREDERGFFARTFCEREFASHGLLDRFVQCNISINHRRGTLRGMHFQRAPKEEVKLVRCARGRVWDVILDLRPDSSSYLRWAGFSLDGDSHAAVYVPAGCAHGFQTLTDDAHLFYQMGEFYDGALADGVRWNDPAFRIEWPISDPILSERDRSYPDYERPL